MQSAWQGTINAEDRYFSNKYYKQVILGDAFFGSDKALKDSNATYAIVKQLAADNDLFYRKFTAAMQKLTWLGVDPLGQAPGPVSPEPTLVLSGRSAPSQRGEHQAANSAPLQQRFVPSLQELTGVNAEPLCQAPRHRRLHSQDASQA